MMNEQQLALPLKIDCEAYRDIVIHDSQWRRVASFPKTPAGKVRAEQVTVAVNSHEQLVEALEALKRNVDISTIRPGKRNEERWAQLLQQADAAIAFAAGERGDAAVVSECDECGHPMRADDETHYPECERINVT